MSEETTAKLRVLGEQLRALREGKNYSLLQAARKVGSAKQTYQDYEKGRNKPGYSRRLSIERIFGMLATSWDV